MQHRNQRQSSSRNKSGNKDKSCGDELKDGARKLAEGMHGESDARVFPSVPKYGPQYSTPEYEQAIEGARRLKEGVGKSMQGESEAHVFPFVPKYPPQHSTPEYEQAIEGARRLKEGVGKSMQGESEAHVFPFVPKHPSQRSTGEYEQFKEGVHRLKEGVGKSIQGESEAHVFPFVPKHPPQYGPEKLAMRAAYSDSTSSISGATYSESPTSTDHHYGPNRKNSLPYRPGDLSTVQEEPQRYSPQKGPWSPAASSGTGSIHGDPHQSHRPSGLREEDNRDIVSSPPPRSRVPTEKPSRASSRRESRHSAKEERTNPQTRSKVPEDRPTNTSSQRESRHSAKEERPGPQTRPKVPEAEDKPTNTSSQRESRRNSKEGRPKSTTGSVHSKSAQTAEPTEPARRVSNTPSGKTRRPPSTTSSYAQSVETSELPHNTVDPRKEVQNRVKEDKGTRGSPLASSPTAATGSGTSSKNKAKIQKWLTNTEDGSPNAGTPPSSRLSGSSSFSNLS